MCGFVKVGEGFCGLCFMLEFECCFFWFGFRYGGCWYDDFGVLWSGWFEWRFRLIVCEVYKVFENDGIFCMFGEKFGDV